MLSNTRKGFTLVELLIVVVIIGILAAIAIPKFATTKEKAYLATMKTDLRNLVTAQEGYFSDNQAYTTDTAAMGFTASKNVSIDAITLATAGSAGYSAEASHSLTGAKVCEVQVGGSVVSPQKDGVPFCS